MHATNVSVFTSPWVVVMVVEMV